MMNDKAETVRNSNRAAIDTDALEQRLREQSRVLCARLTVPEGQTQDAALRQDIADIAAGMLILTTAREGNISPIPALLAPALSASTGANAPTPSHIIAALKEIAPERMKS